MDIIKSKININKMYKNNAFYYNILWHIIKLLFLLLVVILL